MEQVSAFMPDVIFMDNWLPDVNGIIATQQTKSCEAIKHIPVIYFTLITMQWNLPGKQESMIILPNLLILAILRISQKSI